MREVKARKRMEQKKGLATSLNRIVRTSRKETAVVKSVTRDEIDRFWIRKKMEEEEHLIAAEKAAARLRARALTDEDYRRFEESIKDTINNGDDGKIDAMGGGIDDKEVRVGIKDWWTNSKYAYLNQPDTESMGEDATSSYVPQKTFSYSPVAYQYASSFTIFKMANVRSLVM